MYPHVFAEIPCECDSDHWKDLTIYIYMIDKSSVRSAWWNLSVKVGETATHLDCRFLVAPGTVPFVQSLGAQHDWSSRYQELLGNIQLVLDGSYWPRLWRSHSSPIGWLAVRSKFVESRHKVELFISPQCLPLVTFLAANRYALRMRPNALARGCAKLGPEVIRKLVGIELVDFLQAQKKGEGIVSNLSLLSPSFNPVLFPFPDGLPSVSFCGPLYICFLGRVVWIVHLFCLCWIFCRLSVFKNYSCHPCASNTMIRLENGECCFVQKKKTDGQMLTNVEWWSFERIQVAHRLDYVRCIQERNSGQIHSAPWSVQSSLPSSASFPGGSTWNHVAGFAGYNR